MTRAEQLVSVPIRGSFNLTLIDETLSTKEKMVCFRPHQGII